MAITSVELFDSGSGGLTVNKDGNVSREVTLRYLLSGVSGYSEAEAYSIQEMPLVFQGHLRERIDCRNLGSGYYEVTVNYKKENENSEKDEEKDDQNQPDSNTISFDTTGGTANVLQAIAQERVSRDTQGDPAPDIEKAINVEGDQVRGVDITIPQFSFSETWTFPSDYLVNSYFMTLYEMTGTINNKAWRIFQKGEVLFMGARGEITRGAASAALTFQFAVSKNEPDFKVGNTITVNKGGWDYLSVTYETVGQNNSIIKRPRFAYVNTVYKSADFMKLQLGNKSPGVYLPRGGY